MPTRDLRLADPTSIMLETLPLDILLYIIDLLAGGDYENFKSLRILSQACKSMVPLCRKHLFSSLRLKGESNSERFSNLLSKNPDIASYVRSLTYAFYYIPISGHELNIIDMLKQRSHLQSIRLSSLTYLDWNDFPESIRSSLVSLFQLPTVTFLDIYSFKRFPAMALSGCGNLIDLRLGHLKLAPPEANQVISRSKIPTPVSLNIWTNTYGLATLLNSASLHAGDPLEIVDLSSLQKAGFNVDSRDGLGQVYELIKVTTRLEYFTLTVVLPLGLAGLGACLAINAYQTLKSLYFNITVEEDDFDPLCDLSRELRFIAGKNILEMLELKLFVRLEIEDIEDDASFQTVSEECSAFDSMLTESGAFPMLHQVSVAIWWPGEFNKMNLVMESLKKDRFPRLVESKAVEFNFSNGYS